jgi:hypothetical protein
MGATTGESGRVPGSLICGGSDSEVTGASQAASGHRGYAGQCYHQSRSDSQGAGMGTACEAHPSVVIVSIGHRPLMPGMKVATLVPVPYRPRQTCGEGTRRSGRARG